MVILCLKMLKKIYKRGYLSHLSGFEVKERIWETEAVLEAENVTLAFMDQFGRFIPQNAHKNI